jgi:FkbM family methyltransferase
MGVVWGIIKWRLNLELIDSLKSLPYATLKFMARPLVGKGLKLKWLRSIYSYSTNMVMPENQKVIKINDYLLKINNGHKGLDGTTGTIAATGKYEPLTTSVFQKLLSKDKNIIDVGANIGYYSLLSGKLGHSVLSIEPEPHNFELLKENIILNHLDNIAVLSKAVSNQNGKAKFYVSKEESGEHSLIHSRMNIKDFIEVDTIKLDDCINGDKVDLIKTDTEGNEIAVINGAEKIINSNPEIKIVTEVWFRGLKAAGYNPEQLWEVLNGFGFKYFYVIDEVGNQMTKCNLHESYRKSCERCENTDFSINLLCSRSEINELER